MIYVQVWLCNVSLKKEFRKSEEKMKMSKQKDKNLVNVHYQFSVLFSKKLFSYFDFYGWFLWPIHEIFYDFDSDQISWKFAQK